MFVGCPFKNIKRVGTCKWQPRTYDRNRQNECYSRLQFCHGLRVYTAIGPARARPLVLCDRKVLTAPMGGGRPLAATCGVAWCSAAQSGAAQH